MCILGMHQGGREHTEFIRQCLLQGELHVMHYNSILFPIRVKEK